MTFSEVRRLDAQYTLFRFGFEERSSAVSRFEEHDSSSRSAFCDRSSDVRLFFEQFRTSREEKCPMPVRSAMFCPDTFISVTALRSSAVRTASLPAPFRLPGFRIQLRNDSSGKCEESTGISPASCTPEANAAGVYVTIWMKATPAAIHRFI